MKRGDKVPVTIAGHVVAQAEVKEFGDGTATLVVPATMVVMGTRTDLTDLPKEEPSTQVIIDGVDRVSGQSAAVVETPAPVATEGGTNAASVGETTVVDTGSSTAAETPGESASTPASPVEVSNAE